MKTMAKDVAALLAAILIGAALFSLVLPHLRVHEALAAGATLRLGDRGEKVREAQQKLKNWHYLDGAVDGIFGTDTQKAVKYFQRKNGLTQDGIIGTATAAKMGLQLAGSSGSSGNKYQGDVNLLARVVYGEARGEPYRGKVAVAAVVLNRVRHASFPNTMSGVVYQKGAFSIVADGQINLTPDSDSIRAARDALNGVDPTSGCIYYYNPDKTNNKWMLSRPIMVRIGRHVFCR